MSATDDRPRGRPKTEDSPASSEQILDVALRAFARLGYEGVSVRMLNRELGVSHNLIHQRFGAKHELWEAAVDHGFGQLVSEIATSFDPTLTDPLDQLAAAIRRYLHYSARHPELFALMTIEAGLDTPRLDYIYDRYVLPALAPVARLLEHLAAAGRIRPVPPRTLFFLIAHGAASPFSLLPLALRIDPTPPLDDEQVAAHARLVAELITTGISAEPPR